MCHSGTLNVVNTCANGISLIRNEEAFMSNPVAAAARLIWKLLSEATWTEGAYSTISRLRKSGASVFEATHVRTGIRSSFKVVDHVNVGCGYMIRDTEGKIAGLLSEWSLMHIKAIQSASL